MILKIELQKNLNQIYELIIDFINLVKSDKFFEDYQTNPEILDELTNELITKCDNIVRINELTEKEKRSILDNTSYQMYQSVLDELRRISYDIEKPELQKKLDHIYELVVGGFKQDSFKLINCYNNLINSFNLMFSNRITDDLKIIFEDKIAEILNLVPADGEPDAATLSVIKSKVEELYDLINERLTNPGYGSTLVSENDINEKLNDYKKEVDEVFPSPEHSTAKTLLDDFSKTFSEEISAKRKEKIDEVVTLNYTENGKFSKFYPFSHTVPDRVGCGYKYLLFLKDKYRKTILPLIMNSGGNCVSFDILLNTDPLRKKTIYTWDQETKTSRIQEIDAVEQEELFDDIAISDYKLMVSEDIEKNNEDEEDSGLVDNLVTEVIEDDVTTEDGDSVYLEPVTPVELVTEVVRENVFTEKYEEQVVIEKNSNNVVYAPAPMRLVSGIESNKWWSNLKEILEQASILDMFVIITLQDFSDETNPFLTGVSDDLKFTDAMWRKDVEESFYTKLLSFIKETKAKVIINLGHGNYINTTDVNNEKYVMYPTCGYLRKMINFIVYQCGFTSNWLGLTANQSQNLYYYSPYCEWYCFDDDESHELINEQMFVKDVVDDCVNDNAICVSYDDNSNITGGYAKSLISCSKYSIPIYTMLNLKEKITEDMNIDDPNIMSKIFCFNSRNAMRYFKTDNYFEFTELEFDEDGEIL